MTTPFVHLHCHSHYSFYNGTASPGELLRRAKEFEMPALALTDFCNLHGTLEFCKAAKADGIKPIIGSEVLVDGFGLTLLVMNKQGLKNLMRISSLLLLGNANAGAGIGKKTLQEYNDGLICLSGFASGEIARQLSDGKSGHAQTKSLAAWFYDVFGDRYYLELRNHGIKGQKSLAIQTAELGKELGIPTVATSDIHYLDKDHWNIHDMLLCLKSDKRMSDKDRPCMDSKQHYFRSGKEMCDAMPEHRDAIERTLEIVERINPDVLSNEKKYHPAFPIPAEKTPDSLLWEFCLAGLEKRYGKGPNAVEARRQLAAELAVIHELGFDNYFLIFGDIARFLEDRKILHTARGSAVGSMVCYALFLSHECPIENEFFFERFLDRNCSRLPEIYIDIDALRYAEFIAYLDEKYGKDHVAETVHFERMSPRKAVRNAARVLGLPICDTLRDSREFSDTIWWRSRRELISFCDGDSWKIKGKESLYQRYRRQVKFRKLLDHAKFLEGLPLTFSNGKPEYCTAPAWIVSDTPLWECLPTCQTDMSDRPVIQWNKDDPSDPFLQLNVREMRDLTVIFRVVDRIRTVEGIEMEPYQLPLDDRKTFEMLARGDISGICQFEEDCNEDGYDMSEFLYRLKPDCFSEIVAAFALFRPGPLEGGMADRYIDVKHGRKTAEYVHPVMEEILRETYGVPVYQEQIMRILNTIGNVPLANTFNAIKAICKKRSDIVERIEKNFLDGASASGVTKETAKEIFDLIVKFAPYGFCKSHAVAYGRVGYMTAYLKAHYPVEFMTALH